MQWNQPTPTHPTGTPSLSPRSSHSYSHIYAFFSLLLVILKLKLCRFFPSIQKIKTFNSNKQTCVNWEKCGTKGLITSSPLLPECARAPRSHSCSAATLGSLARPHTADRKQLQPRLWIFCSNIINLQDSRTRPRNKISQI